MYIESRPLNIGDMCMKVLLPNHFPLKGSGSGIYTQNVARELLKLGHEALVIAPDHQKATGYPFPVRTILFSPDQKGGGRGLPFNFPCFTTHPRSNVTFSDLTGEQMRAYVEAFMAAIHEAVVQWRPDVIHAQHLWVTTYCAAQSGVPYVATSHGTDLMGYRRYPRYREIATAGVMGAAKVIAISRQVARDACQIYNLDEDKVTLIWNGFDADVFKVLPVSRAEVLSRYGLPPHPPAVVSFVGKLTEFKGVDVLLRAAQRYEREIEGVITLIVGHGALDEELRALARELGLQGVHFLGHQPQEKVARIYNIADVSVAPSRVEPFGLVAIEALACGTPVVATNEGGLPDFINERVGALVSVDDAEQLATAIVREIYSHSKQTKGKWAAQYALAEYSWSQQVKQMVKTYQQAIGPPARAS
ncbi:MAG: glycosyltransferase family 4 protein [Chloroflexi bacterium]|nr:MAG: glycosyltransferase family 4 protein [Chloroflexota bacterium]